MRIKINSLNDVYEFVKHAQDVDGDIIVSKGKFHVDGKSVLGILSLDMSDGVNVTYPEEATAFGDFLSKFEI